MSIPWNADNAAHLLRRAGFGATPAEINKSVKAGQTATIKLLLKKDKSSDKLPPHAGDGLERLASWWVRRMITTKTPLTEKLTLFWHNHFATGNHKVDDLKLMHDQNRALRKLCMAKFRDLAVAVAKDPAMIYWLDTQTNLKGNTNKNFARELQELFTTGVLDKNGVANYTEFDVDEAARAFTGWQTDRTKFVFNEDEHDFDTKTFKGHTGPWDGGDIISFLAVEDATARRICKKLFSFFAYDVALNDPVVDALSTVYLTNDTAIEPVLSAMFQMDEFYSSNATRAHVLGPAEFLASTIRVLGAVVNVKDPYSLGTWCQALGQSLFDPPSVFGWKEGPPWVSTAGILERARVAERIADGRKGNSIYFEPKKIFTKKLNIINSAETVDRALAALSMTGVASATRTALIQYLESTPDGADPDFQTNKYIIDAKARGLIAIILSTPEYQFS